MLNSLLIILAERFSMIALLAFILSRLIFFKKVISNRVNRKDLVYLVVIFSIIGILGTYVGIPIKGAIANSRVVGPMVAGLLGGPYVGLFVGLIAGLHRLTIGGFTAFSCALSTTVEGLIGGLIKKYYRDMVDWKLAFLAGFIGEALQMVIILAVSRPFSEAVALVKIIGLPMMIVNSTGIAIFILIIRSVFDENQKIASQQAKIALEIASKTLPFLRKGLNQISARKACEIIYKSTDVYAVAITDRKKILAHVGAGNDHHKSGMPILTQATKHTVEKGKIYVTRSKDEIGCPYKDCPLTSAVIAPLYCYDRLIGTLKLYRSNSGVNELINSTEIELAKGLSHLISYQLEIADAEYQRKLASEAKFNALQAQINPHFLFNSLNTVVSFIHYKPEKAGDLLLSLSEYLRNNIKNAGKWITIAQELENIEAYLQIESARFKDKIRIEKDIDQDVLSYYIPSFILQPIVENAVKHGILPKDVGGTVAIRIKNHQDSVRFVVEDDGVGIEPDKLKKVLKKGYGKNTGVGLYNVYERLRSVQKCCFFKIDSRWKRGTRVTFDFPKNLNREEVADEVEVPDR